MLSPISMALSNFPTRPTSCSPVFDAEPICVSCDHLNLASYSAHHLKHCGRRWPDWKAWTGNVSWHMQTVFLDLSRNALLGVREERRSPSELTNVSCS